ARPGLRRLRPALVRAHAAHRGGLPRGGGDGGAAPLLAVPRSRGLGDRRRAPVRPRGAGRGARRSAAIERKEQDMTSEPAGASAAVESRSRRHAALRTAITPLVPFLDDDAVVEIMLNADGRVWIERAGVGMSASSAVLGPDDALRMLRVVATEMNVELSDRSPSLAGKLPIWGARVQGAIPPIVEAPVFSLRKPARLAFALDHYVERMILSASEADALRRAVRERANILVGGGTGSGKTTFANALLREVASTGDRTYIVEDNPELQCAAPNRLQVLVQPPVYTWNRAILDAMRFRPDRIIVGEVRDGAALEMLKAWNTGHPGGIGTIHAN